MSGSWHMTIDAATQKPFFYNTETKETSWTAPPGFQDITLPPPPQQEQQSNPIMPQAASSMTYATPVYVPPVANPWNKTQDEQGRTFWYNTETKATSWTDPNAAMAVTAHNPWNMTQDAQGRTFWYNTETKATSWTDPNAAMAVPAHNPWNMTQDAQGRTFWYNTETKATSWTDPNSLPVAHSLPIQINVQPGQLQMQQITDPRALDLGHRPFANVQCPACQRLVTTQVELTWGNTSCLVCCVGFLIFWPCCCLPCCIDEMKDADHHCPYCRVLIKKVNGKLGC